MKTLTALILLFLLTVVAGFADTRGRIGVSPGSGSTPDSIARYDLHRTFPGAVARKENWGGSPLISNTLTKRTTIKPQAGFDACWVYSQWLNIEGADAYKPVTTTPPSMIQYRSVLDVRWLYIVFDGAIPDTITRTMVQDADGDWYSVGSTLTTEQLHGMFRADPSEQVGNEVAQITVNRRANATFTAAYAVVLSYPIPVPDSLQIWAQTGDIAVEVPEDMAFYGWIKWYDLPNETQLLNTHCYIYGGTRIPYRFEVYPQLLVDKGPGWLYYRGFGMSQGGYTIASNPPWATTYPFAVDYDEDGAGAGDADADGTKGLEEDFYFFKDARWPIKTRVSETATPATGNVTLKLWNPGVSPQPVRAGLRAAWLTDLECIFAHRPFVDPYGVFGLTFTQRNAATAPYLFDDSDTSKVFRQFNVASRSANPWVFTITQGENGVTGSITNDSIDCLLPEGSVAWDFTSPEDTYTGTEDDHSGWYNWKVKSFDKLGHAAGIYVSYGVDSTYKTFSSYEVFAPDEYRWGSRFSVWREKGRRVNSAIQRSWLERYTYIVYTFDETPATYTSVVDSLTLLNTKYFATRVGNATMPSICYGAGGGSFTEYTDSTGLGDNIITSTGFHLVEVLRQNSNSRFDIRHASWTFNLVGLPNIEGAYYEDVLVDSAKIYFAYNNASTPRDEATGGDSVAFCGWNFGPGLYPTAQSPHDHKTLNTQPIGVTDITTFLNAPNAYTSTSLNADTIRFYLGDTLRLGSTVMRQNCRCIDDGAGDDRTFFLIHGYGTAQQPYLKIWRRLRQR